MANITTTLKVIMNLSYLPRPVRVRMSKLKVEYFLKEKHIDKCLLGAPTVVSNNAGVLKHFKSLSNSSSDSDYLGTCVKCAEKIVGEGTGCSAMGRPYHILCFTCSGG